MRLIDADELNEYIGRESLDTREKIFALVDRMPTLPNPCGKPCAFERPHGEWLEKLLSTECSVCHKRFEYLPYDYRNFCSNCGARMEAGDPE